MSRLRTIAVLAATAAVLAGCSQNPLRIQRSACPAVAIPTYAGDLTLFKPGTEANAANIDVVAVMTNARETCSDSGEKLVVDVSYDVLARRSTTAVRTPRRIASATESGSRRRGLGSVSKVSTAAL